MLPSHVGEGWNMISNILRAEWMQNALPLVLTIVVIGGALAFALS